MQSDKPPLPPKKQGWITLPIHAIPYTEREDYGSAAPTYTVRWKAWIELYGLDGHTSYGETADEAVQFLLQSVTCNEVEFKRLLKEASDWMK